MKWDSREGIKNIKDISIEIIQFEEEKGKMWRKMNRASETYEISSISSIHVMRVLGRDKKYKGVEKISEKIMT